MTKIKPWYRFEYANLGPHAYFEDVYLMTFSCKSCDYSYDSYDANEEVENACPKCGLKHIEQKEVR